jgi:hypothetical protein
MVGRAPSSKCHNTSLYITSRIDSLTICNLLYIPLQRCHDPANGRKCKNEQFRKCGPANLESMHIMLRSAHVTGATASTPRDLSDNPSDDEVYELEENPSDVMLSSLQKREKSVRPLPLMVSKIRKREEAHFYDCIRILVARYKEWTS